MEISIRFAEHHDLDEIVAMWVDFMGNGNDILANMRLNDENIRRWRGFARSYIEQDLIRLAELEGRPVGYILISYAPPPLETLKKCGNILDLYVKKEHRGKGYGTLLMHDAIDHLRHMGCQVVALTVLAENSRAIELYEREGFQKVFHTLKKVL